MSHTFFLPPRVTWTTPIRALTLLLGLLTAILTRSAAAQEIGSTGYHPNFFNTFNCFPNGVPIRQRVAVAGPGGGGNPAPKLSEYGIAFTPRGEMRVLVVYAGFTNDNVPRNQGGQNIPYNNDLPDNPWPQTSNGSAWGESLPPSAANNFYTSASQFSTSATDQTLSNFYY